MGEEKALRTGEKGRNLLRGLGGGRGPSKQPATAGRRKAAPLGPNTRPPSRQPFWAQGGQALWAQLEQVPPQTQVEGEAARAQHSLALARPGRRQICCLIPGPRSLRAAALTMLSAMAAAPASGLGPRAAAACLPKGLTVPASASAPASRRRRHSRSSFAARLRQRRRPVLRSTHSGRRTQSRNKVPAPPTAARMRMRQRAHLGTASLRRVSGGRASCATQGKTAKERLVQTVQKSPQKLGGGGARL